MRFHLCLSLLALVLFTSPAALAQSDAASTSSEPAQTVAESCRAACERDFTLCREEGSAARDTLNGRPSANVSAYRCDGALSTCLDTCRGL
jgi:hypothetical protein